MAEAAWLLAAATGAACLSFGLWYGGRRKGRAPAPVSQTVCHPAEGCSSAGSLPEGGAPRPQGSSGDHGEEERLRQRVAWLEEWHVRRTRATEECLEAIAGLCGTAEECARRAGDHGDMPELLGSLLEELRAVAGDLRRSCSPLQAIPRQVTDLPEGLEALAHALRHTSAMAVVARIDPSVPHHTAGCDGAPILQVVAEALTNVQRHSRASRVALRAGVLNRRLVISIADDGQGFDLRLLSHRRSGGLSRMRAFAEALRGDLQVETAAGAGTIVTLSVPLEGGGPEDGRRGDPHSRLHRGETTPITVQEVMAHGGGASDPGNGRTSGRTGRQPAGRFSD